MHTFLSFKPLVTALRKSISEGTPGIKNLYGPVVERFENVPELMNTITDMEVLQRHRELIEEIVSAVLPPTTANYMYGVSLPFTSVIVQASPLLTQVLQELEKTIIGDVKGQQNVQLNEKRTRFAFGLVLRKYMGYDCPDSFRTVVPYQDKKTGFIRNLEIRIDTRFIDISPVGEMPILPDSILDPENHRIHSIEELMRLINLEDFRFEGLSVIRVNDVTELAIQQEIRDRLIDIHAMPDAEDFIEVENSIKSLIDLADLNIGITPFFKINNHYIYSDLHNKNSLLFSNVLSASEKDEISDYCKLLFRNNDQPVLYTCLETKLLEEVQCLKHYYQGGGRSLILCPLKKGDELLGMLEISSKIPEQLTPYHIQKIESTLPLFTRGLEKSLEQLNSLVDNEIKKKFTAVQPAVEWKFTETAFNYIIQKQFKEDAKIERIAFHDVFPLYGVVDIRNSSTARSQSVQRDTAEQLNMSLDLVRKAMAIFQFPILQEIEYKIEKYLKASSDILQSEEEIGIHDFLKGEVASLFLHLKNTDPEFALFVDSYFSRLDAKLGLLYKHRKEYEESVSMINDTLSRFIDKEQIAAQKVYPHYFERYITDGLDFNIYIGQSITPRKKFDEIYLRNLKMWQLTILAKAARITDKLEKELPLALRTTQMILSHSQPLSIAFRTAERKFDVDGAYNSRYEIIKKRIDKVRTKESNERLTQPGKIAIVYSQSKEASEYEEYIEFLQDKSLLKPGIEKLDLEELQGVTGLKAIRVEVNLDQNLQPSPKTKLVKQKTEKLSNT